MAPCGGCRGASGPPRLLLLLLPLGALAKTPALHIKGSPQEFQPPTLQFGKDPASAIVISEGAGQLQVKRNGEAHVTISGDGIVLPEVTLDGDTQLEAASLSLRGVPQWSLFSLETFEPYVDGVAADPNPWSVNDRTFCSTQGDEFLGGYCKFAATATTRRYQLPPHTKVRISGRVHYLDAWLGESVLMQANGETVWAQAHNWCPGILKWMCTEYGISTCGSDTPDRLSVHVEATIQHTAPTLDLTFTSSLPLGTDPCKTSWGVDDVSIELI
jgi:hypothetical protein